MKKSLLKDILRNIKHNLGQFISIVLILTLGVSFFIGIQVTGHYMRDTGNRYFEQHQLSDAQLTTSLGVTDETVKLLESHFPEAVFEPITYHDVLAGQSDSQFAIRLYQSQQVMDQYQLMEGRDIEADNEILLDSQLQLVHDLQLGDTFEINDPDDLFESTSFEVVGFIQSVYYIDTNRGNTTIGNGSLEGFGYVSKEALSDSEIYSTIAIRFSEVDHALSYDRQYEQALEPLLEKLNDLDKIIAQDRYDSIVVEPTAEIADAQATLNQEIADALSELDEAAEEIEEGQSELDRGLSEFNQGVTELYESIEMTPVIYQNPQQTVRVLQANVDQYKTSKQTELSDGLQQIEDGLVQLQQEEAKLKAGQAELALGKQQVNELLEVMANFSQGTQSLSELRNNRDQMKALVGNRTLSDNFSDLRALSTSLGLSLDLVGDFSDFEKIRNSLPVDSPALIMLNNLQDEYTLLTQLASLNAAIITTNDTLNAGMKTFIDESGTQSTLSDDAVVSYQNLDKALDIQGKLDTLNKTEQQLESGMSMIMSQRAELINNRTMLQESQVLMDDGFVSLDNGVSELRSGAQSIIDGQVELAEASSLVEEGYLEVEVSRQEAQSEIDDALLELKDLELPTTYVLDRSDFVISYKAFGDNSLRIENIGQVFPLFFFIIAALVSMTTIRRMVEEQVTLMGVYKAIGYSRAAIQAKTMVFSILTLILGLLFGAILGYTFFPTIIYNAYRILYNLPDIETAFVHSYFYLPVILSILATVGIAWLNSYQVLRQSPAQLMRPQAPPAGKRVFLEKIGFIWKRLSFLQKVSVRNILRNKSRFLMSVIGIAGCTGLLVTGFGMNDSIMGIPQRQFVEFQNYDALITYDEDVIDMNELNDKLAGHDILEQEEVMIFTAGLEHLEVAVNVFESDEAFKSMLSLEALDGSQLNLSDEGAILSKKAAQLLGVSKGDTVTLTNREMNLNVQIKVDNIVEYYVEHGLYLSETYASQVGIDVKQNGTVVIVEDADRDVINSLSESVLEAEGVYTVVNRYEILDLSNESMESFYIVVVVVVLAAAALAMVVMYNLSSMNIAERERELATLKVLGFYPKETASYIFRESIIMTLIGILFGVLFGLWLHGFVVSSAELDNFGFVREIKLTSILISCALTLVFSYVNELIMRKKINDIDMLSALKSVE